MLGAAESAMRPRRLGGLWGRIAICTEFGACARLLLRVVRPYTAACCAGGADNKGKGDKEVKEESNPDLKAKGKDKANTSASACFCAVM